MPAGGKAYVCPYSIGPLTKAQKNLQNTVTVTSGSLAPVVDVAIIDVLASPPRLEVHKEVRVFRHGLDTDWQQSLTVHQGPKVDPTVWYRLRVTNTGGSPATGFTVQDSTGPLTFDADCPRPPSSLGPGATYWCFYPETYRRTGTVVDTLKADSKETAEQRDTATVSIQSCGGPSTGGSEPGRGSVGRPANGGRGALRLDGGRVHRAAVPRYRLERERGPVPGPARPV